MHEGREMVDEAWIHIGREASAKSVLHATAWLGLIDL